MELEYKQDLLSVMLLLLIGFFFFLQKSLVLTDKNGNNTEVHGVKLGGLPCSQQPPTPRIFLGGNHCYSWVCLPPKCLVCMCTYIHIVYIEINKKWISQWDHLIIFFCNPIFRAINLYKLEDSSNDLVFLQNKTLRTHC